MPTVISPNEFAEKLLQEIKTCWTKDTGNLKGSVWNKKQGETRVYLKTWKGGDCGFVTIRHDDGQVLNSGKSYVLDVVSEKINQLLESFEVGQTTLKSNDPISLAGEMCWRCHYNVAAFDNGLCVSCVD